MILNFIDTIDSWLKPVKEWIRNNDNAFFVVIIFGIGLALFFFTYKALHKDK